MITTTLWTLIALQIAIGAFDTLFHHELTERLAWRKSQAGELKLHGIRNLFYAVLFVGLGTAQVFGIFAMAMIGILVLELVITLKDFVEEDKTRKLPASERVAHTLLALNYGAILTHLVPILIVWAGRPAGIAPINNGYWGLLMVIAGIGVGLFGLRDLAASRRLDRMRAAPAIDLWDADLGHQNVLITGGTGFIGSRLIAAMVARGHTVTVLTRDPASASHLPAPIHIITDLAQIGDDARIDTVINLAGEPVAGNLWTARFRRKVLRSRLKTTRRLVAMMARLHRKPATFISGSAIGIYGVRGEAAVDERIRILDDGSFSHRLCADWEREALKAETLGIRTICLRIGLVLDTEGGPLAQMLVPFELGGGGPFGNGRHWMSWITRDDLVRLVGHCLGNPQISGPVNATAPGPVPNHEFASALGRALQRPAILPVPGFVLTGGLKDLGREIFLGSQHVLPGKALDSGFRFTASNLDTAFKTLLSAPTIPSSSSRLLPEFKVLRTRG